MQYLLLIYNDAEKINALSRAEHETMAEGYRAWIEAMTESGVLRGTGTWPAPGITTVRVNEGKTLATDGPFAEAREGVGGFCVIEAKDRDEAIAIAARIPSAATGAVEVRAMNPLVPGTAR
jgi:hypothetical protein